MVTNQNVNMVNAMQSNVLKHIYKVSNLYLIFSPHTQLNCEPLWPIMIQLLLGLFVWFIIAGDLHWVFYGKRKRHNPAK